VWRAAVGLLRGASQQRLSDVRIRIAIDRQRLELFDAGQRLVAAYPVSTAANGPGELYGSECTPRGVHTVRAKIGEGCAINTVFVRRRPTGEIWTASLAQAHPDRDWMLTRLLWLSGRESGFNRGGNVDSLRRKIYIHGTGEDALVGRPGSHGCIRLRSADVIALFGAVQRGTEVEIVESASQQLRVRATNWRESEEALRRIRREVFVREQGVPDELEWDDADPVCRHVLAEDAEGAAIGCGRLLADGFIGRVAVLQAGRGRRVGSAMLSKLVDLARYAGFERVALNARADTQAFYARHGFAPVGGEFVDVGIRHQCMERVLAGAANPRLTVAGAG
jgi:predicted GNAT family N-acyltransferase